ncbi:DUF2000 domain-containing protein [Myroides odoratimimus]|uniref:DUF2000 domain-containing protein n=1 Tax=Myroides odoratimimus TaxID=76832 RepID=UPI0029C0CEC5|nr:DUF2000 domain-containing protein [Myroides odoratimimus]MDX4973898.1 DUF2000 domain-containing protein [Myroides odoratimimus]
MKKCVLIIDPLLSTGVIANVAGILSMSIGSKAEGFVGKDVIDKNNFIHGGLPQIPVPVLGAGKEKLRDIIMKVVQDANHDILVVDFNNFSQQARTYDEYTDLIQQSPTDEIVYMGIALYGDKKSINNITKKLKLIGS